MPTQVIEGDAFSTLPQLPLQDAIITSLPDAAEINLGSAGYLRWLASAVRLCSARIRNDGLLVFYQTDRKIDGEWLSKPAVIIPLAGRMLWHKIVVRHEPGTRDLYRPGYTHLLAFSRTGRVGAASPDVLRAGRFLWKYGMGYAAAQFVAEYARTFGAGRVFCDPFCGYGTSLLAAAHAGFSTVTGVDIDPVCCAQARRVSVA